MSRTTYLRVFLVGDDPRISGGIGTHLSRLSDELGKVVKIETYSVGPGPFGNSRVRRLLRRVTDPLRFAVRLLSYRPDVVHLNASFDRRSVIRELFHVVPCRILKVPVILQFHGGVSGTMVFGNPIDQTLTRLILQGVDRVVYLTAGQQQPVSLRFPALANKLLIIPNMAPALDDSLQHLHPRREHEDFPVVLFLSRVVKVKGILDLLQAIHILNNQGARLKLVVAGDGPDTEEAQGLAESLGISHLTVFLGHVGGDAKVEVFRNATVLVLPTYHAEGIPYTILEAMRYRLPIVVCASGGITEILDESSCMIVPPRDPPALAEAISILLGDDSLRARLSQAAWVTVTTRFDAEIVSAKIMTLYSSVARRAEIESNI